MGQRSRVLSFSMFGSPPASPPTTSTAFQRDVNLRKLSVDVVAQQNAASNVNEVARDSPSPTTVQKQRNRSDSQTLRPMSLVQSYHPAQADTSNDTIPELQPIFSYLNSHTNKLYHEGYFLKLHDLDSRGRPSQDRTWTECFAQLAGTILSLWDAAALDAAGEEGEVLPTFLNISDASIKMIEELPMHGSSSGKLENVLSISTAANNRYLFHFNSINSLTQWTAGIRLSMYEHATLQEAYTGALIAGKGRLLNNIRGIMKNSKFPHEDWVRVRFGAGAPWRRCWCVTTPPDEKEYQKAAKEAKKKNSYARKIQTPKGDIKFYESQKVTKKTKPIATITDAYAAYAIYPQSKPLIEQSTLIKVEGLITIHVPQETTSEAFIFVMPEVRPAISGFEMMLRWLFPVYDTLVLYGRPNRLVADARDQRGLMFAMPTDRRYGYLDDIDVSALIHTEGSQAWSERQWRMELKKCTAHKMEVSQGGSGHSSPRRLRASSGSRTSLPGLARSGVRFQSDESSGSSSPTSRRPSPVPNYDDTIQIAPRQTTDSPLQPPSPGHQRSASDAVGYRRFQSENEYSTSPSDDPRSVSYDAAPATPQHGQSIVSRKVVPNLARMDSDNDEIPVTRFDEMDINSDRPPVTPVASPPAFIHNPNGRPAVTPYQAPELRRATSEMDTATLVQMQEATSSVEPHETWTMAPQDPSSAVDPNETWTMALQQPSSAVEPHETLSEKAHQATPVEQHNRDQESQQQEVSINVTRPDAPADTAPSQGFAIDSLECHLETTSRSAAQGTSHVKPTLMLETPGPNRNLSPLSSTLPEVPTSPLNIDGLDHHLVDSAALDRVLQNSPIKSTSPSAYDQAASTAPARTRLPPGARAGKLRVTGDTSMRQTNSPQSASSGLRDAFDVNFVRPHAQRNPQQDAQLAFDTAASDHTGMGSAATQQPMSRTVYEDVYEDSNEPYEATSHVRPALAQTDSAARLSLSPEQWVQHRAEMASQAGSPPRALPQMSHPKSRVSSVPDILTPSRMTSPGSRDVSAEWSHQSPQSSHSMPTGDYYRAESPKWTAGQERTGRANGSPLVSSMSPSSRSLGGSSPDPGQSLYGTLQAREEWRRVNPNQYRSGPQAMAVQQHQQQHQQQQAYVAQTRAAYQSQQAVHAAQMAQYQAFLRQQQAQAQAQENQGLGANQWSGSPRSPPHNNSYSRYQ